MSLYFGVAEVNGVRDPNRERRRNEMKQLLLKIIILVIYDYEFD